LSELDEPNLVINITINSSFFLNCSNNKTSINGGCLYFNTYVDSSSSTSSTVSILNSFFYNCSAGGGKGGAVYITKGVVILSSSFFGNNTDASNKGNDLHVELDLSTNYEQNGIIKSVCSSSDQDRFSTDNVNKSTLFSDCFYCENISNPFECSSAFFPEYVNGFLCLFLFYYYFFAGPCFLDFAETCHGSRLLKVANEDNDVDCSVFNIRTCGGYDILYPLGNVAVDKLLCVAHSVSLFYLFFK
jgi:hypothetical protein